MMGGGIAMSPGIVVGAVGVGVVADIGIGVGVVVDGGGGVGIGDIRAWTPPPPHLGLIGIGETWR